MSALMSWLNQAILSRIDGNRERDNLLKVLKESRNSNTIAAIDYAIFTKKRLLLIHETK